VIRVGDNPGGRERVSVTPISSKNYYGPQTQNNSGGHTFNIHINGNLDQTISEIVTKEIRAGGRGVDRLLSTLTKRMS
jgi:hypothetical protein